MVCRILTSICVPKKNDYHYSKLVPFSARLREARGMEPLECMVAFELEKPDHKPPVCRLSIQRPRRYDKTYYYTSVKCTIFLYKCSNLVKYIRQIHYHKKADYEA
jgi:hypothetical protein